MLRKLQSYCFLFIVLILYSNCCLALNEDIIEKLKSAETKASEAVALIYERWQIGRFPNFLKSCFMHKSAWELLLLKFQSKIISAVTSKDDTPVDFVISFLGSSVTAGHDSHYNYSFPVVVGELMSPVFSEIGIKLHSRNVALGNNPCIPYDICVKYFAGFDADIVHWEQTYFCRGKPMEHFLRQAMTIPTKPVIVFSESATHTWKKEECDDKKKKHVHVITEAEKALLRADTKQVVMELNKDEFHRAFPFLSGIGHFYHGAGIQTFHHMKHIDYMCQGPYPPEFQDGAAPWHPSILGHNLRASHHAYFWLMIWIDALHSLQQLASLRSFEAIQKDIETHQNKIHQPIGPAKNKMYFPDDAKCYTDYVPRSVKNNSLKNKVLHGLKNENNPKGWQFVIYENLVKESLVQKSIANGYLDFKYLLFGNEDSGPLSLKITLTKKAPIFLCQTPGIWGHLPKGFVDLWDSGTKVFLTRSPKIGGTEGNSTFLFNKDSAKRLSVWFHKKELEICAQLRPSTANTTTVTIDQARLEDHFFQPGDYALTIVPTSKSFIILAWVVTG